MAQPSAPFVEDKPLTPTSSSGGSSPKSPGPRPRILVVNDDGIKSLGLKQLAEALEEIGDVVVVSTIDNQIHPSFSITIQETIRAKNLGVWGRNIPVFAVTGFPMNCLKYAYGHVIPNILRWQSLDIVIAGINKGRNVGTDLLYSGTMSLACAARFGNESFMPRNKTPKAIAISLCPPSMASSCSLSSQLVVDWDFATAVVAAKQITRLALASEQTPNVVWNVNVPGHTKHSDKKGVYCWAVTRPAELQYDPLSLITVTKDEASYKDFVVNGPYTKNTGRHDIGTDLYALSNGVISISPIEVSPSLHTPLHATNNLIDLFMTDSEQIPAKVDPKYFWNINVNIRPLRCIVQCLEYWLRLKTQDGAASAAAIDDDNVVVLQTYTLYLQRDINICPEKPVFAEMLSDRFGWSPQHEKFTATLTWGQMRCLYAELKEIESAHSGRHCLFRRIGSGLMFIGAVALSVAGIEYLKTKRSAER